MSKHYDQVHVIPTDAAGDAVITKKELASGELEIKAIQSNSLILFRTEKLMNTSEITTLNAATGASGSGGLWEPATTGTTQNTAYTTFMTTINSEYIYSRVNTGANPNVLTMRRLVSGTRLSLIPFDGLEIAGEHCQDFFDCNLLCGKMHPLSGDADMSGV